MKVLVTGASGFIGRAVTELLCKRGYEVHAVARERGDIVDAVWHQVDLFDNDAVQRLLSFEKPSHLIHFAWTTEPGKFWNSEENHEWERATRALFDMFADAGGKRFIGAGSCAEYEWNGLPCVEVETKTEPIPSTLYGRAKRATWNYIEGEALKREVSSAWGRIFWLYGPREHPKRLIPHVITGIMLGSAVECTSGEQLRDFMHVADVAEAFVRLLESNVIGPINIAAGKAIAIREIVSMIAQRLSGEHLIRFGAISSNAAEPEIVVADVERLRAELLFSPGIPMPNGIADTIDWWKAQMRSKATSP